MSELILRGVSHYRVTDATQSVPKSFRGLHHNDVHYTHWTQGMVNEAIQDLVASIEEAIFHEFDIESGEVPNTPETRAAMCKTIDEQLYAKLMGGKVNG
ncbi:hypothetical protein HWC53_gp160 [Bacillus phage vB_BmeM-Goe8]|uniref:Uncharacterized protein n=1 Tax=Bacillus phage vB_BmeM-Goe8 TaxID=2593638 RepID=A0A516KMV5_9CAUD|nr:hypothetical protein HWC53_gp160 [Bacillus phage vB_BmeM-Goe8]QDP42929.1 hypothetical protein Goe8_c01560 [Bacillus phage vB_BmeM-Goe8]